MFYIYQYSCPITLEIKYIGQTTDIDRRFKQHKYQSRNKLMYAWIHSLEKLRYTPIINIIATAETKEDALKLEQYHIEAACRLGAKLFNVAHSSIDKGSTRKYHSYLLTNQD